MSYEKVENQFHAQFNGLEERLNARINKDSLENIETVLEFVYNHLNY